MAKELLLEIFPKKAEIIIKKALELGINTFDTADTYSLGNSEIRLGNILKEYRKSVNIFTKAGAIPQLSNTGFNYEIDLSYNHLLSAIDRSLNRLKTDYIDLFQTHAAPKSKKDFESVKNTFVSIKKDGIARYCGVSVGLDYENGIKLIN